jgi:hypothetical protein
MIKFSNWLETHSVQQAAAGVRGDRKDLGAQGFEGLQDAMDALKVAAKDPRNSSALSSIFGRLSALVSRQDPDLATRLGGSARKFVSTSKNAGHQPLGDAAGGVQNNQIQR